MRHSGFVGGEQQNAEDAGKLQACGVDAELFGGVVLVDNDAVQLPFDKAAGVVQHKRQAKGEDVLGSLKQAEQADAVAVARHQRVGGERNGGVADKQRGKAKGDGRAVRGFQQGDGEQAGEHAAGGLDKRVRQGAFLALAVGKLHAEDALRGGGAGYRGKVERLRGGGNTQRGKRNQRGVAVARQHHAGQVAFAVHIKIARERAVLAEAEHDNQQGKQRLPIRQIAVARRAEFAREIRQQQKGQGFGGKLAEKVDKTVF